MNGSFNSLLYLRTSSTGFFPVHPLRTGFYSQFFHIFMQNGKFCRRPYNVLFLTNVALSSLIPFFSAYKSSFPGSGSKFAFFRKDRCVNFYISTSFYFT